MFGINRYVNTNDWVSLLCLFLFLILAIARSISPYHFKNFMFLIATDKYLKTHKDDHTKRKSHYVLSTFYFLSIPLLCTKFISSTQLGYEFIPIVYLKVLVLYVGFFSLKYFLEKLIGFFLKKNMLVSNYLFHKQSYYNYIAIVFFPFLLISIYYTDIYPLFFYVMIGAYCFFHIFTTITVINNYRSGIFSNSFYFILYICSFEIAPYILSFFVITKIS